MVVVCIGILIVLITLVIYGVRIYTFYLMESFYRAGGIPAVMKELMKHKKIHTNIMTVSGKNVGQNLRRKIEVDRSVIKTFKECLTEKAGFLVMKSNFFSTAVMKTSVISKEFRDRYLSNPKHPNVFNGKAVVFEGPEDYHKRLNSKKLNIDGSTSNVPIKSVDSSVLTIFSLIKPNILPR